MEKTILVAYSTVYGSTQEIAEALVKGLRACSLQVDLQPARGVRSLDAYQAVVLGAPLYMFRWHKDAHQFLSRHRESLQKLPVAVFALGPFHNEENEWQDSRSQFDKELAKYPWLTPVECKVFGGKFDPSTLRFPYNLLPALKQLPPSDIRDWSQVDAWATSLSETL